MAVLLSSGVLALAGCGNSNVNAVQENDSVIQSVTDVVTSDAQEATESVVTEDVITPQEIQPNAIIEDTTAVDSAVEGAEETTETEGQEAAEVTETEATGESYTAYTSAGINLRASASGSSDVLNTIEPGEEITVLGSTEESWTLIRYDGEEGYIASRYITTDADEAAYIKEHYYDDEDDYDYDYDYDYDED